LGTRIGVARWVVVGDDYRTCLGRYRRSEHLTASTKRVDSSRHCHLSGSGPSHARPGRHTIPPSQFRGESIFSFSVLQHWSTQP
jgi:hypothetical protein